MEYNETSYYATEDINDGKNQQNSKNQRRRSARPRPRSGIRVRIANPRTNPQPRISTTSRNPPDRQQQRSSSLIRSSPATTTADADMYNYHQLSSSAYNNNAYERNDHEYNNTYEQNSRAIEEQREHWKLQPPRSHNKRISSRIISSPSIEQRISDYKSNKKLEQALQWQGMTETVKSLEKENQRILENSRTLQARNDSLNQEIGQLSSENHNLVLEIHDLKSRLSEITHLTSENRNLVREIHDLKSRLNEIPLLTSENHDLALEIHSLKSRLSESHVENQQLIKEKNSWMQKAGNADLLAQDLSNENRLLKAETTKYQSALGKATNIRLADNDNNSSINLIKDIAELQHTLKYFSQLKGKDIKINGENALNLVKKYNCQCDDPQQNKSVLSAVLQRHILDKILKEATEFFQNQKSNNNDNEGDEDNNLEKNIVEKTKDIISIIHRFVETRHGTDNIAAVTPIHLRQQIYGLLSNRGFATAQNHHPFLDNLKTTVIEEIDKYRTITNETRKQEQERRAEKLINETLRIFCFGLPAQEPPAQYMWIEAGSEIQSSMMEGPELGGGEDEEHLEVEVCSFPVIGANTNEKDNSRRQIYSKAKVHTRERMSDKDDYVVISDTPQSVIF
ncbi:11586_t:CDS:1 [Ambispora gerdemannii]|uniref:11586_t:CDS:1 n=1 Tax=Ambispora gerdemannii TaxID=144530 RepID=A0A9N8WBU4_9GLOM|nr:11586_t:CDS:1 [Ambispora gerdemannii]